MAIQHADDLITVAEAADLLRVSTVTIKRWLKQGRLPAYHVGPRAIRLRRADLAAVVRPVREPVGTTTGRPTQEELARRKALVEEILVLREQARISPLTTADLVELARDERTWYGDGR